MSAGPWFIGSEPDPADLAAAIAEFGGPDDYDDPWIPFELAVDVAMRIARPGIVRGDQAFSARYLPLLLSAAQVAPHAVPAAAVGHIGWAAFNEGFSVAVRRLAQLLDINGDTLEAAVDELGGRGLDRPFTAAQLARLRQIPPPRHLDDHGGGDDLDLDGPPMLHDDAFYAAIDAALGLPPPQD